MTHRPLAFVPDQPMVYRIGSKFVVRPVWLLPQFSYEPHKSARESVGVILSKSSDLNTSLYMIGGFVLWRLDLECSAIVRAEFDASTRS